MRDAALRSPQEDEALGLLPGEILPVYFDTNQLLTFPKAYALCLSQQGILPRTQTRAQGVTLRRLQQKSVHRSKTPVWGSLMQLPGSITPATGWVYADGNPVPDDRWKVGHPSDIGGVSAFSSRGRQDYHVGYQTAENGNRDCAVFAG